MTVPALLEYTLWWTPVLCISWPGAAGQPKVLLRDGVAPGYEHVRSCTRALTLAKSPQRLLHTLGNLFYQGLCFTDC